MSHLDFRANVTWPPKAAGGARVSSPSDALPLRETREQLEEAERLRKSGQLDRARALCEPMVARFGDYFGGLHTLGLIYADLGNYPMALGFLVRAVMLNPSSWTTLTALSGVYLRLGAPEMAAHTLEQARKIEPNDSNVLATLGEIYAQEREFELAADAFRGALALEPSLKGAAFGLVAALSSLGDYNEAAAVLERFFAGGAGSLEVLTAYSLLPSSVAQIDILKELEKLSPRPNENMAEFDNSAAFVRAIFLDKTGRYKDAWQNLVAANTAVFATRQQELRKQEQAMKDALAHTRDLKIKVTSNANQPTSLFVLGPSRSGKTSLERMLGGMAGVKRGYENPIVETSLRRTFQGAGMLAVAYFEALPPQFFPMCRDIYLKELAKRATGAKVFTNTHPGHIYNAARIASVFPNVRFVFVKRNADDNALRIYMRKYYEGNPYAYDLKATRNYISWYHEMIDVLAEKLPDQTRVFSYEEMVANPAAVLREVADLCALRPPSEPLGSFGDDRGCAGPYREFMAAAL